MVGTVAMKATRRCGEDITFVACITILSLPHTLVLPRFKKSFSRYDTNEPMPMPDARIGEHNNEPMPNIRDKESAPRGGNKTQVTPRILHRLLHILAVTLAIITWFALVSYCLFIMKWTPIKTYSALEDGSIVCPANTLYSHTNATNAYCISTTGWHNIGKALQSERTLPDPECAEFDQQGYSYNRIVTSFYDYCDSSSRYTDSEMSGVPFVNYTCVNCTVYAFYRPGSVVCHPCICRPADEALGLEENLFPTNLRLVALVAVALLGTVNIVYYFAVAISGNYSNGRSEFLSTGVLESVSLALLASEAFSPPQEFTLYPESGWYNLNAFVAADPSLLEPNWSMLSFLIMVTPENTMSALFCFSRRAQDDVKAQTHHNWTWGADSRGGGIASSIAISLLFVAVMAEIVFSFVLTQKGTECSESGTYGLTPVMLGVAGSGFMFFGLLSCVAIGFGCCGPMNVSARLIPRLVTLGLLFAIDIPEFVSAILYSGARTVAAWAIAITSALISLYLGATLPTEACMNNFE
jgi:hypothetical protein